jgi:hypothetical protein
VFARGQKDVRRDRPRSRRRRADRRDAQALLALALRRSRRAAVSGWPAPALPLRRRRAHVLRPHAHAEQAREQALPQRRASTTAGASGSGTSSSASTAGSSTRREHVVLWDADLQRSASPSSATDRRSRTASRSSSSSAPSRKLSRRAGWQWRRRPWNRQVDADAARHGDIACAASPMHSSRAATTRSAGRP